MNIPINIKYGDIKATGSIPQGWEDVTFKQYLEFVRATENGSHEGIYEALTGIKKEIWEKPHDPKLYLKLDRVLGFTRTEPVTERPTHIERNGKMYPIKKDFLNVPLSKYRDLIEVVNKVLNEKERVKDSDNLEIIPKMVAIFACDSYADIEELEEIAKEIEQKPCAEVYTLGAFFLRKFQGLKSGTKNKPTLKARVALMFRRVIQKFLVVLVLCITFILSPKLTFYSLIDSLKKLWARFILGYNYKILSLTLKKNIPK